MRKPSGLQQAELRAGPGFHPATEDMANLRGSPGRLFGSMTSARSLRRCWPQAGSSGQLSPRAGAREEGEDFADGELLAGGYGQREMCLDLVAVAAAVFVLDDVAGRGQVGDDAVSAAPGDAHLAAMSRSRTPGSCAMHGSTRAWLIGKLPPSIVQGNITVSRNRLLVFHYLCKVRDRHCGPAADGG